MSATSSRSGSDGVEVQPAFPERQGLGPGCSIPPGPASRSKTSSTFADTISLPGAGGLHTGRGTDRPTQLPLTDDMEGHGNPKLHHFRLQPSRRAEVRFHAYNWKAGYTASFAARDQLVSTIEKIEGNVLTIKHRQQSRRRMRWRVTATTKRFRPRSTGHQGEAQRLLSGGTLSTDDRHSH